MTDVYRFKFIEEVNGELIESQINLAIVTAECTFGRTKVKLDAGCLLSKNKVVIDASNEVGKYIAQVFTGLMARQLGEDKFTVERVRSKE